MANTLSYTDAAAILNEVVKQATGQEALATTATQDFVTVAQIGLKSGYNALVDGISQVLSKTIFSARAYNPHFRGLMRDTIAYGNHVRKVTNLWRPAVTDGHYTPTDGTSYGVKFHKPETVQTNFYGAVDWQDSISMLKDQVNTAMQGPAEFGAFVTSRLTEMNNKRRVQDESMARMALCNFIGGKMLGDTGNVIHLLSEYNAKTGLQLTKNTVWQPENFKGFVQFVYSRVAELCSLMTEDSAQYHTNLNINGSNKIIMRHTPYDYQNVYLTAGNRFAFEMMALADTYHDTYLKMAETEAVNFWQNIKSPSSIKVFASYLAADGTIKTQDASKDTPATSDDVLGVIFDDEAIGVTTILDTADTSPYNSEMRFWNIDFHSTYRYWNDFTENGVVLLLD